MKATWSSFSEEISKHLPILKVFKPLTPERKKTYKLLLLYYYLYYKEKKRRKSSSLGKS